MMGLHSPNQFRRCVGKATYSAVQMKHSRYSSRLDDGSATKSMSFPISIVANPPIRPALPTHSLMRCEASEWIASGMTSYVAGKCGPATSMDIAHPPGEASSIAGV